MIELLIVGNLGKDAQVTNYQGKNIINFSVAHTEKYKNAEGVEVNKTTWVECSIWRNQGESIAIAQYLKKGTQVLARGIPEASTYTNSQNQAVPKLKCKVNTVQLLGSAPAANNNAPAPSAPANSDTPEPARTDASGAPLPF
jgi:single-strand DNA-binding protein